MVQTNSSYKATGEPLTMLQVHRRPAQRTSTPMASDDEGVLASSNLTEQVAKLTTNVQHSGFSQMKTIQELFKVEAKVDILVYDGVVEPEKLDSWLDQLETYFNFQCFSNAQNIAYTPLKMRGHAKAWWKALGSSEEIEDLTWNQFKHLVRKEFYPMGYLEDRWNQWHRFRQRREKTVQDSTTEFRRQPLTLGVSLVDSSTCTNLPRSSKQYPTYDKELLALYHAVKHWWTYLLGKETIVHTNHHSLQYLQVEPSTHEQYAKWYQEDPHFQNKIKEANATSIKGFSEKNELLYKDGYGLYSISKPANRKLGLYTPLPFPTRLFNGLLRRSPQDSVRQ
ncbi:hypothetical protein ACH5RR_002691 [Cinchona calisaya]|uniref:Retrotransposon gag domain-containing protein n=1 Tax=Cinchona calisaya TaxID=153742 RepID=A0ABD3AST1_9GENT